MSEELEELARRLVVSHKTDGRKVFDKAAKAELVALCARSDKSVSRLAREYDINANQLSRWIREHHQVRSPVVVPSTAAREAFISLPVAPTTAVVSEATCVEAMSLQAKLPNGVVVDVRGVELQEVVELFEALGRMRCSASTKD